MPRYIFSSTQFIATKREMIVDQQHAPTLTSTQRQRHQLICVAKIYGFISSFISPMSTKLGRMVDQEMMTSPQLGDITNIYGFVFNFLSPIMIILGREFDRHELKLASTWIRISYLF